jgi:glycosyltransferase involved in cell wall biosynthesis
VILALTLNIVGSDNFIVTQRDVKQLYGSLRILVEDEEQRQRIGANNRARAEELVGGRKCCEAYAKELMKLSG